MRSFLVLVVTASAAFAQPTVDDDTRSEKTALWLSLGGTIGAYGVFVGGAALGEYSDAAKVPAVLGGFAIPFAPSFGHWYADKFLTRGLVLRGAGAFVAMVGAVGAFSTGGGDGKRNMIIGTFVAAGALWVGGTVDDIVTAPRRARDYNKRTSAQLVPLVQPNTAGLALAGTF